MDHNYEQQNAKTKGVGGVIGISEYENALQRWLLSGLEVARLLEEFEVVGDVDASKVLEHYESDPSYQMRFLKDVKLVSSAIDERGNPFMDDSLDLYNLHNKELVCPLVIETLYSIEKIGKKQFEEYFENRICRRSVAITKTFPKNKLHLFSAPKSKVPSKKDYQLKAAKCDISLFSRLFIACQSREGDLAQFFAHENQTVPPSLSKQGELRPASKKSAIIQCILQMQHQTPNEHPVVKTKILDGAVIINMLPPGGSRTVKDYAMEVFLPYVCNHLKYVERLDIVWDRYFSNSLKKSTRSNRGAGIRLRVTGNGLLPKDWLSFLRCSENKKEIFPYISQQIIDQADTTKLLITTLNENALCNQNIEIENLMSCNLEKADERIFLHVQHAAKTYKSVLVKTVDSDIVVIALYAYQHIQNLNELWIEFGVGKSLQFIPIHEISNGLEPSVCNAYLFFHSFSGCDTTSSLSGIGKSLFMRHGSCCQN